MRCCYCHEVVREVSTTNEEWVCLGCGHTFDGCECDDLLRDDLTPRYSDRDDG